MGLRVSGWLPRLNSRRSRRIATACVATLGISGVLFSVVMFSQWRTEHAVRGDTRIVLDQAAQQLLRALQSRRGTLTLLRDTLDQSPGLSTTDRQALAESGVTHTRHLLGIGLLQAGQPVVWWATPPIRSREHTHVGRTITERSRLRNAWRVPSSFTVVTQGRSLLVMLEPLRAKANRSSALVGVFDLNPLLVDFFELTLQQPYPVQLIESSSVLYQSGHWQEPQEGQRVTVLDRPLKLDAVQWMLHMQPGSTQAVQTISWFSGLLAVFSIVAGLALVGLIWLLAMRTWILQRAVVRRTAALRRTTDRLRQLAITDEVTGLFNRRFFLERWQWEYDRAKRYQRPLGCLMIDVNRFKRINDMLGHHSGDLVLKQVAQELKHHLRQSDILARFGGDEFVVALPETSKGQATAVAEKLRQLVIHGPWTRPDQVGAVSLSVGLGYLHTQESAQQLLQEADTNLYRSKRAAQRLPEGIPETTHAA